MKIQVINPNTTATMTASIRAAALRAAADRFEIVCSNPHDGPEAIEAACDTVAASPGLLSEIRAGVAQGCAGHVIACFDDPAVPAARELATGPVVGICEGSMIAASLVSMRFSIVTTTRAGIPIFEDMAHRYGFDRKCLSVRSCDLPVLALDGSPQVVDKIRRQIDACLEDGAEAIILGCAGMAQMAQELAAATGVPVIEGVGVSVQLMAGLASVGLRTSKRGVFATPHVLHPGTFAGLSA
jgi:allantoin racemase